MTGPRITGGAASGAGEPPSDVAARAAADAAARAAADRAAADAAAKAAAKAAARSAADAAAKAAADTAARSATDTAARAAADAAARVAADAAARSAADKAAADAAARIAADKAARSAADAAAKTAARTAADAATRTAADAGISLPDAPQAIAKAILTAQRDASEAYDAAIHAALGDKGGPLRDVPDAYRDAVEKAMRFRTNLGADVKDLTGPERARLSLSQRQAAQKIIDDLTNRGLTGFTDSAGRNWSLDRYADMATRTASQRMHLSSQLSKMAQAGNDVVTVENDVGPCDLCDPFVGEELSLSGDGPQTSLSDAVDAGLLHPNCRCEIVLVPS